MEMKHLIVSVRERALEQYEDSYGWSVIVECYTDQEIQGEIIKNNLHTVEEVLAHFDSIADLRSERYQEAQAEIF